MQADTHISVPNLTHSIDFCGAIAYLVDKILTVVVRQGLGRPDYLMQVRVHQFIHNVQVVEGPSPQRLHDVFDSNDVLMIEMPKQPDFSQRPARIGGILECIANFLDSNLFPSLHIPSRAHNPVSALPNRFYWLILCIDLKERSPQHELVLPRGAGTLWGIDTSGHAVWLLQLIFQHERQAQIRFNKNPTQTDA
jgi:hypothetical protein